jgi:hypothetical protein
MYGAAIVKNTCINLFDTKGNIIAINLFYYSNNHKLESFITTVQTPYENNYCCIITNFY